MVGNEIVTRSEGFILGDTIENEENILNENNEIDKFKDIEENDWYYEAVRFACIEGLFKGVSEDLFGAQETMNRAMLVTVLHRLDDETEVAYENKFDDVPKTSYYEKAINWATQNNIVSGTSEFKFSPTASLTREQLVTILYRYANYKEIDTSIEVEKNIEMYEDFAEISKYAVDAFTWACENKIITGKTATTLAPKATATRAEVATILMRLRDKM